MKPEYTENVCSVLINGQTQLGQANRGIDNLTGLLLNNLSNVRGHTDTKTSTSTNDPEREAKQRQKDEL